MVDVRPDPARLGRRRPRRGPRARRGPRPSGSRTRASSSSRPPHLVGELAPAGREQLDAVVGEGVVGGRDDRRRDPASADSQATAGVGRTPRSTTSTPSPASPADRAACSGAGAAGVPADQEGGGRRGRGRRPARGPGPTRGSARRWRRPGRRRCRTGSAPRGSALGVLRRLAGLLQAVLLGFLLAGVPGEEAGLLEAARSSGSSSVRARAMPRRRAPAWPETPPPSMVASMS